jgi:hypothetical protein
MSGEKSSAINYDRRGEIILNIRSLKEDLLRKIIFLKKQTEDLIVRISKEQLSIKHKKLLDILNNQLNIIRAKTKEIIEDKGKSIGNFSLRNLAPVNELEKDLRELLEESNNLKNITNELNMFKSKVSEIVEIDDVLSKIDLAFSELVNLMESNKSLLQEWSPSEYEDLIRQNDAFKEKLNKYIAGFDSGKIEMINFAPIKEFYKDLRNHINKVEGIITNYTIKDQEVKSLKAKIGILKKNINDQLISVKDTAIKNLLGEYLNRLKIAENELGYKKYQGLSEMLDKLSNNLPLLKRADEIICDIEDEMSEVESIFKENNAILTKWVVKDYQEFLKEKENIYTQLEQCRKELYSEIINIGKLNNLFEHIKNLLDKLTASLSTAQEKEELHQKRLYIIQALREVCASLGFQEIDTPHYEEEGNAYSPVVQSFDTLNLGTIAFRVALEGRIDSSSGISVDKCDEEFSKLSEILKEKYGVETAFKRVGEEEPIKKYKTAKDLPQSKSSLSQKK